MLFGIYLSNLWFYGNDQESTIGQETPLIIHLSDFGFEDESVEKNHSWTDGLGNNRYECTLLGNGSGCQSTCQV